MAKKKEQKADEAEPQDGAEAPPAQSKQGFLKTLLGNRKMLAIAAGALLLVLLGSGAALYFFVFSAPKAEPAVASYEAPLPATPPQVVYYDVPDLIVNIQSADGSPAYLKLSTALELDRPEEKAGLAVMMPRIVDQFQGYLRELRIDDLKGSAGVLRLKEELLRRINAVAQPYRVHDVLLKEMIVQ
ncbi:MAG: flagellar basal body-associated FliL family protein [Alphaproteobacteria bacterium]|nr:flagellar basal body-associated FliL family protein [Alphaproteobacteria bacterium]MBV9694003.1 flagellar basal body-associated FliL family protein [Alphaproteobacteria bacterium]